MTTRQIVTHAFLPNQPDQVWKILSDFRAYFEWNPLNVAVDGDAVVGARVPMSFIDPGHPGKILRQTVQVTVADEPSKLEWVGRIPLLFTGRHFFELRQRGGGTDLTHGEILSGLIPTLWSEARMEQQRRAYEEMNRALERRLSDVFSGSGKFK